MSYSQDKWHDKDIDMLIKLIQVHPCLWNSQSEDYKNCKARDNALNVIGKKMGVAKEEVKKKYRNLRTQYIREIRNSKNRGYLSRWIHFNALKFLSEGQDVPNGLWDPLNWDDTQDAMERLQSKQDTCISSDIENDCEFTEEFLDADETYDDIEVSNSGINENSAHSIEFEGTQSPPGKRKPTNQNKSNCTNRRRESKRSTIFLMKGPIKQKDEYTIFGEYVANELRILKNRKQLQNSLKCAILQAILDVNKAANGDIL